MGMTIKTTGWCGGCAPKPHTLRLGDTDCFGRVIGYFDEDGLAWESRERRDCVLTAGRFTDALGQWKEGDPIPSPLDAAMAVGCLLENLDAAIAEAREDGYFWLRILSAARKGRKEDGPPLTKSHIRFDNIE